MCRCELVFNDRILGPQSQLWARTPKCPPEATLTPSPSYEHLCHLEAQEGGSREVRESGGVGRVPGINDLQAAGMLGLRGKSRLQ